MAGHDIASGTADETANASGCDRGRESASEGEIEPAEPQPVHWKTEYAGEVAGSLCDSGEGC